MDGAAWMQPEPRVLGFSLKSVKSQADDQMRRFGFFQRQPRHLELQSWLILSKSL